MTVFTLYDLYAPRQGHTFPIYGDLESEGWEKDVQCNMCSEQEEA